MRKLLSICVLFILGVSSVYSQGSKNDGVNQMHRNVVTFQSQNFIFVLDRWVNYPNDIGAQQEILRSVKIEITPTGATVHLPILNRIVDQPYSIGREGAFKVFDFKDCPYEIISAGYNKSKSQYKALVSFKDPLNSGMTLEFVFYKNGSIQVIGNATSFERTIFGGFIIPKSK